MAHLVLNMLGSTMFNETERIRVLEGVSTTRRGGSSSSSSALHLAAASNLTSVVRSLVEEWNATRRRQGPVRQASHRMYRVCQQN